MDLATSRPGSATHSDSATLQMRQYVFQESMIHLTMFTPQTCNCRQARTSYSNFLVATFSVSNYI